MINLYEKIYSIKLEDLINCSPRIEVQITCAIFYTIFWFIALRILENILRIWINKKNWKQQWLNLTKKNFEYFGIILTDEPTYNFALRFLACLLQHLFGGFLCIPALLPSSILSNLGISYNFAISLACHGALSETGFEIEDILYRLYDWIFEVKEKRNTNFITFSLVLMHHLLGMFIVIPMNLYFSDYYYYHEGVFILQFAGAAGVLLQNYGYTLNIEIERDLFEMKINSILIFLIALWTRVIRYFIIGYHIIYMLNEKADYYMIVGALISFVSLGILNLMWTSDALNRLIKYLPMRINNYDSDRKNDCKNKAKAD